MLILYVLMISSEETEERSMVEPASLEDPKVNELMNVSGILTCDNQLALLDSSQYSYSMLLMLCWIS